MPIRFRKAAVGHGAVHNSVDAFAGLEQDSSREEERVGSGINDGAAGGTDSDGAVHFEEARGVHVKAHFAIGSVDEHVVGPASNLQMALRVELGGRLVVDRFVGAEDVVLVVDDDVSGEGQDIADSALALRF